MPTTTQHDLQGRRILLVEDEYFIAADLAMSLEGYGATVLGPAGSIQQAMALLDGAEPPDAAVLDVNLNGQPCFPLADLLAERAIPFVFTTGYDEQAIPEPYRRIPRCQKPISTTKLATLLNLCAGHPPEQGK